MRVLSLDIAIFADSVIGGCTGADRHANFDLQGTVSAAAATAGSAMIPKGKDTKAFIAKLAIVLILLVSFLGYQITNLTTHLKCSRVNCGSVICTTRCELLHGRDLSRFSLE